MTYPSIILKPNKDRFIRRFHPWVFSGAVGETLNKEGEKSPVDDGAVVRVLSHKKQYLGTGHFQEKGSVSTRIFDFGDSEINESYWKKKIKNAVQLRKDAGLFRNRETNAFRLVNAEGDHMPGFIADWYKGHIVFKIYNTGMYRLKDLFSKALCELLDPEVKSIYDKSSASMKYSSIGEIEEGYIFGEAEEETVIMENGNRFRVDWQKGQKTGFFLDQRENRKLVQRYSKGKTVLNAYSYTGGFSISALRGGAERAVSVDSSETAIKTAEENTALNDCKNHKVICADVQDFLKHNNERFDLIILDPPAFAKHRNARHKAVQAYKRLNSKAMKMIADGGILFTFSCSEVVNRQLFNDTITAAAIESGREVKVLHQLAQALDHPFNIYHPEGEYLKGLVLYVR